MSFGSYNSIREPGGIKRRVRKAKMSGQRQMYCSPATPDIQAGFCQRNPYQVCNHRNLPHPCYDYHCSFESYSRWARREARVLARFLKSLSADYRIYYGHLTPMPFTTVAAHKPLRSAFLAALRRQRRRKSPIKLRACLHIVDNGNGHYDYIAYAPASVLIEEVRRAILDSWQEAGGYHGSCVLCPPERVKGRSYYLFGYRWENRGSPLVAGVHINHCRKPSRLPAKNKLPIVWGTEGFYQGTNVKKLWKELCPPCNRAKPHFRGDKEVAQEEGDKEAAPTPWHGAHRRSLRLAPVSCHPVPCRVLEAAPTNAVQPRSGVLQPVGCGSQGRCRRAAEAFLGAVAAPGGSLSGFRRNNGATLLALQAPCEYNPFAAAFPSQVAESKGLTTLTKPKCYARETCQEQVRILVPQLHLGPPSGGLFRCLFHHKYR